MEWQSRFFLRFCARFVRRAVHHACACCAAASWAKASVCATPLLSMMSVLLSTGGAIGLFYGILFGVIALVRGCHPHLLAPARVRTPLTARPPRSSC